MKIANLGNRLVLVVEDRALDVEEASSGRFPSSPQAAFDDWDNFLNWAGGVDTSPAAPMDPRLLDAPVPHPTQVFAIGINYAEHAKEAGYSPDAMPVTFTKFPTCLTGPDSDVVLPTDTVDWEVEAVVAISRHAEHVHRDQAWDFVAGLTVGQDLSERTAQLAGSKPQFSLAKSYPGFGPTGPWLVTPDELDDPDDLALWCQLDGQTVQESRTSYMIYDIPRTHHPTLRGLPPPTRGPNLHRHPGRGRQREVTQTVPPARQRSPQRSRGRGDDHPAFPKPVIG